jgi:sec-independent protein translocase protein TatB
MLDFGWSQMVLIAVIALIVLGPKELPKVIKTVTELAGKARSLAREFKSSVDDMVRESDIKSVKEDLEQAAYKAESEVNKQVGDLGLDHSIIDGTATPADSALAGYAPASSSDTPEWVQPWPSLRGLSEHERKKKPVRAKVPLALKPRLIGAPAAKSGAAAVRRKVRA